MTERSVKKLRISWR